MGGRAGGFGRAARSAARGWLDGGAPAETLLATMATVPHVWDERLGAQHSVLGAHGGGRGARATQRGRTIAALSSLPSSFRRGSGRWLRARALRPPSERGGKGASWTRPGRVLECTLSGMALGFLQYLWDPATLPSPTRLRAELQTNRPRHRPHPRPGCHPNPAHLIHPWLVIQVLAIG